MSCATKLFCRNSCNVVRIQTCVFRIVNYVFKPLNTIQEQNLPETIRTQSLVSKYLTLLEVRGSNKHTLYYTVDRRIFYRSKKKL